MNVLSIRDDGSVMETWIDDWLLARGAHPPKNPVDQLTPRQVQILDAISSSRSNPR